ncbi:hypothetical protein HDV02_004823 [Globomyces sp. JEL0801]|nr:hypothetical protein HDV02_004823 [Globomyces sp. JEL0801]
MRQPRNMRIVQNNLNQPAADPDVIAFEANENLQLLKGLKSHKQYLGYWNSYRKFIWSQYENANELQQNIHLDYNIEYDEFAYIQVVRFLKTYADRAESTLGKIHAAIKHFYGYLHPQKPNPASHTLVMGVLGKLKNDDKKSGRNIKRAKASTKEDLERLHGYLFSDPRCQLPTNIRYYIWAVAVVCWNLFLRINEVMQLTFHDYNHFRTGSASLAPSEDTTNVTVISDECHYYLPLIPLLDHEMIPYDELSIKFRKTRQNDHTGITYTLYDEDPKSVALQARTGLMNWCKFMYQYYGGEEQFYRKFPLNSDEIKRIPLFPQLSVRNERNGPTTYHIMPGKHDDGGNAFRDVFVKVMLFNLPKIMQEAGIDNPNDSTRTTHTFRRGGCQYRFIYSPKPWRFDMCRAWGGWEGDSVDTMMKYLLEETVSIENGFKYYLKPNYAMNRNGDINTRTETEETLTLQDQINSINGSLALLTSKINALLEMGTNSNSLPTVSIVNTDPPLLTQDASSTVQATDNFISSAPQVCGSSQNLSRRKDVAKQCYKDIYQLWHHGDTISNIKPLKEFSSAEKRAYGSSTYSNRKQIAEEIDAVGGIEYFERKYSIEERSMVSKLRKAVSERGVKKIAAQRNSHLNLNFIMNG